EYPQHMPVREHRDIPWRGANSGNHPINPCADLTGSLSARATIAEDQPSGLRAADLLRSEPLVVAVVPLSQIALDLRVRTESGELAGLPRPLQRAAQHQGKGSRGRIGPPVSGNLTPVLGERNIRDTGVPSAETPFGLAMPDQKDLLGCHRSAPRGRSITRVR